MNTFFSEGLGDFGTITVVMGSTSTLVLVILFVYNFFTNVKKNQARLRRLLTWTTSMPVIISLLALVTFVVPRAADMCDTIKQV